LKRAPLLFAVTLQTEIERKSDGLLGIEPWPGLLRDLQTSHDETRAN